MAYSGKYCFDWILEFSERYFDMLIHLSMLVIKCSISYKNDVVSPIDWKSCWNRLILMKLGFPNCPSIWNVLWKKRFLCNNMLREFYTLFLSAGYSQFIKNILKFCDKKIGSTLTYYYKNSYIHGTLYLWNILS